MEIQGYKYIGLIINQISGNSPFTYLIEINGILGFFEITLNEKEEQALIGARMAFEVDIEKNKIIKYNILEYIPMKKEIELDDWQSGRICNMNSVQRMELHNDWLKKQHEDVKNNIIKKLEKEVEEKPVKGFPKD